MSGLAAKNSTRLFTNPLTASDLKHSRAKSRQLRRLRTFMIRTLKKCNKKLGSPCLFTRQQALKMGYFYWLRVKSSNHLHTESSRGYLKDTKFYVESKASFIDMSSIASFKPFLITWLREF